MKHAKVTTITQEGDYKVITNDSYFEQLAHSVREIEKKLVTSKSTVVADFIKIMEHITKEDSPKVVIEISGKEYEPKKITYRWTEYKESFNRR